MYSKTAAALQLYKKFYKMFVVICSSIILLKKLYTKIAKYIFCILYLYTVSFTVHK